MSEASSTLRYVPPTWATGHVSYFDAAYLSAFAAAVSPATAVEIGVASGYSTAILLDALSRVRRPANGPQTWLHSFDVLEHCYFDPAHRVGEAAGELVPSLTKHWTLHLGDVRAAGRVLAPASVALAFIDAHHSHPWPTLDLMGLVPYLVPGAWVVLHDIRLPELGGGEYATYGAKYLFDDWPWTKASEPMQGNIGALRLDASVDETRAYCERLLDKPWQVDVPRVVLDDVGLVSRGTGPLDDRTPRMRGVVHAIGRQASVRPVVLWGAGAAGRGLLRTLREEGLDAAAFLDRDPAKQGTRLDGIDVRPPQVLDAGKGRQFVVLCGMHANEMAVELDARGFVRDTDYVVA